MAQTNTKSNEIFIGYDFPRYLNFANYVHVHTTPTVTFDVDHKGIVGVDSDGATDEQIDAAALLLESEEERLRIELHEMDERIRALQDERHWTVRKIALVQAVIEGNEPQT
jgi:hypothetical protein